ncbi:MAG: N-6 DNA methylase [Clostridia bacterium]|nr:N-6 DNA methylase [Clostridia bacterium]
METTIGHSKRQLSEAFYWRLVNAYGYSSEQIGVDVTVSPSSVADIAIWRSAEEKKSGLTPNIYVLVSCKAEHISVKADDYFDQYRQAALNDMAFYVALNLKETKVFYIDRTARPLKIEEISDFPSAKDIATEKSLNDFISKVRGKSKEEFLRALSRCHNIIRNTDKLSPEAAFDEISKVLFIKMLYERDSKDELVYSKEKFLKDEQSYVGDTDYIQHLFNEVKTAYSPDGLFEQDDKIKIRRESFLAILDVLSTVNLSASSDDIKGIAFELFLGKTFRGELGQFFTPRTVVDYMVEVLDVKEGDLVCDPCCGSGGFLIKAFEHVQDQIDQDIHRQIEDLKKDGSLTTEERDTKIISLWGECDKSIKGSRYYKLCHDYFFGVDANSRMARTSKMNMIMHGDGHVGVYLHDGLINVGGVYDNRFDVILINPPFGASVEKDTRVTASDVPSLPEKEKFTELFGSDYLNHVYEPIRRYAEETYKGKKGKRILDLYEIRHSNTEILFLERCINLLKPGKRAGIVLPEGILDNPGMERIRDFVEKRARILNITSIPADVFLSSGANIKPSLLFIEKYSAGTEPEPDYEMTVTKVSDAGISSSGLPSDNLELPAAAKEILSWISGHPTPNMIYTKIIRRSDMVDWNVKPLFSNTDIRFNPSYEKTRLGEILTLSRNQIYIDPDLEYTRITVRLFNKGICERDRIKGAKIGTKRQTAVKEGQFVISKIDGKSAAFGIIDATLDGAIVTPDFLVYDINANRILPGYLELVLNNKAILDQFANSSSGTTGRKRLSQKMFESTIIALPPLAEQANLINEILEIRELQKSMEELMNTKISDFNSKIFQ